MESEVEARIVNGNDNNEREDIVKKAEFDKNFSKCQINQSSQRKKSSIES